MITSHANHNEDIYIKFNYCLCYINMCVYINYI